MNVDMRTGTRKDSPQILEVMCRAFNRDESSPRYPSLKAMAERAPDHYQVLTVDGRVAAVVHIARHVLRVGRSTVVKGDVGHVSVHPDFQGQGYGSGLMRHCVEWMRAKGYDISRLGGFARFYARFGWEHFPRRYYEFIIDEVKAGARRLSPDEVYQMPDRYPGEVRPFDETKDNLARWEVGERFNHNRSGSLVVARPARPSGKPSKAAANPLHVVYEREGRLLGYVSANEYPEEVSPFEAKITISDFAYDMDEPLAAGLLVKRILLTAHERGVSRVTARIPFDPRVVAAIRDAGINVSLRELHSSLASNMIQVIGLASTLDHVRPELEARLASGAFSDWRGEVTLSVREQQAVIRAAGGRISTREGEGRGARIVLGHADMVSLLFGVRAFDELMAASDAGLEPAERGVMCTLFPRQFAASGPWG